MTRLVELCQVASTAVVILIAGTACTDSGGPVTAPKIDALKAYYCAVPGQATCSSRGQLIPAGSLPPANEAFQVWAFYTGWVTTHWRLVYGSDSLDTEKIALDSNYVWLNFNGGGAPSYTIHVFIRGASGFLTHDSLRWKY